ncbi:hypothetical protein Q8A73_010349 [Channa argus]|nr:hypothetical protein Q8A73_010349 [Channa argus]
MASKSWPVFGFTNPSAVNSSKLVGLYSEPSTVSLHDGTSDGRTHSIKSKDSSGDRLGRACTRSRNSQTPPTSHRQISTSTDSLTNQEKTTSDFNLMVSDTSADMSKMICKCKANCNELKQQPMKRSETSSSLHECPNHMLSNTAPTSANTCQTEDRDIFKAKYQELSLLGDGGFGKVFSGYCKDDNLKVAIKHVPQMIVERTPQILNENMSGVPVEVALLIKLGAGPEAESSNVTPALLDWFDLEDELILVFERPACSMDLVGHISSRPENLTEEEVKIILTQLLDAAIEMHSRGVFHRDIKLENILIERKAGIQRVRFLDFGCGTTCTPGQRFTGGKGTKEYKPPEWHERSCYMADSTTVWQLGVVMYTLLHRKLPFTDIISIIKHNPLIRPDLSHEGRHFLRHCLIKNPEDRPTLEKLRNHPWLR